jgi:hypothetical protein
MQMLPIGRTNIDPPGASRQARGQQEGSILGSIRCKVVSKLLTWLFAQVSWLGY